MTKSNGEIKHISDLLPDAHNARRHNPRNIGMITKAIREVGAARSGVIDEDGNILAGHGTAEAMAEAGIEKVRVVDAEGDEWVVVRRSGLTPEQKKKLALYDNRTAELAEWDADELKDIADAGVDLSGLWTDEEWEELAAEEGDDFLGEGQEKPRPAEIVCKLKIPPRVWLTNRAEVRQEVEAVCKQFGIVTEWSEPE